jgi:hypothetical protein
LEENKVYDNGVAAGNQKVKEKLCDNCFILFSSFLLSHLFSYLAYCSWVFLTFFSYSIKELLRR